MLRSLVVLCSLCLYPLSLPAATWVLLDDGSSDEGWRANAGREFPGAELAVAVGKTPDGASALQVAVDLSRGGHYAGAECAVDIPQASRLRFRVWSEGVDVLMVRMQDMAKQEHAGSARIRTGSWRTVELALDEKSFPGHWHGANDGSFHFPVRRLLVAASSLPNKKGRFWIRDIEVLSDDRTMLWGLAVHAEKPGAIFFHAEQPAAVALHVRNRVKEPAKAEAEWRLTDHTGTVLQTKTEKLAFAPWERKILRPSLSVLDHGYYLLSCTLRSEGEVVATGEGAFGVVEKLPNYGPNKDPESFFGMHINDVAAAARIGVKWDRAQRAWWWGEARRKDYHWPDRNQEVGIDYGIGTMMTLHYGPPGWAKELVEGQAMWPPPAPLLEGWKDYVAACVQRYDGKIDCWEIQNEPDLTCYYHEKIPEALGIESYAQIVRVAHQAIRDAGSTLPVAGVGVSGGDYRRNLRFSRQALAEVDDLVDVYVGHPYASPRYFGPGKSPLFPQQNHLVEKLELSKAMLRELRGERPIWVGEKGWGLAITEPMASPHSMAYATCVAQALITGRSAPGIGRWFWFMQNGCNEQGHEYGLWRGSPAQPLPAAIAYAGCARFLHHVEPARKLELPEGVLGFAFRGHDPARAMVALWSTADESVLEAKLPAETKAYTMYGRTTSSVRISLSMAPVYLVAPADAAEALFATVEQAAPAPRVPIRVEALHFAQADALKARVRNLMNKPVEVELRAAGKAAGTTLAPKASGALTLRLAEPVAATVAAELLANHTAMLSRSLSGRFSPCRRRAPRVDGDLAEWGKPDVVVKERTSILPADPNVGWSGPDDLSVEAWWGWNEQGLCFAARARDDIHSASETTAGTFWKSDSLQIAVDVLNDAGNEADFDPDDREFGVVAANGTGKVFETRPATRTVATDCATRRQGKDTIYELVLPWSALGTNPAAGKVLSLNFIVNDNDGHGRAYWMGMRPGIGEAKRPGLYLDVVLAE